MPTPEMGWEIPNNVARALHLKIKLKKIHFQYQKKYFRRNKEIYEFFINLKKNYNLNLIYPNDIFCDNLRCYSHLNNIPLFLMMIT